LVDNFMGKMNKG